jgi:hypothetical protein
VTNGARPASPRLFVKDTALALQNELVARGSQLSRCVPDFGSRYLPVLRKFIRPFRVEAIATDAAFEADLNERQLTFSKASFEMFHRPINEAEAYGLIPPEIATIARQIASEQLIVHELAHIPQGIVHFEDVEALKTLVSPMVLGEFDLVADASAARLCARLEMLRAEEKGWPCFADRLVQQLYVMGEYAFKAFKAPANKPHKRQRFLGIAMMTAVAQDALSRGEPPRRTAGGFPIGTPLFPYFDQLDGSMLIFAFDPDRVVWGRPGRVDRDLLRQTCEGLDTVSFAVSVSRAAVLLEQFGQLKRR